MDAGRVLEEAASLDLAAMESGPEGFLPEEPTEASRVLEERGLRLVGGFVPVDAGWAELFEGLSLAEEIGARHGLTVAVHPHFGTAIERPHHVRRFLEGCETGLCLDTGHLMIGGDDPVEVTRLAADRVRIVHLKDVDRRLAVGVWKGEIGFEDAVRQGVFKALGDGDVETERVIELLEESGYGGWYVLEQDIMLDEEPEEGEGPVEDVRKSLHFVRSFLGSEGEDKA
jgi:inosose dehydratase